MKEYRVDFEADWPLWQKLCHVFWEENGYWSLDEMPGWLRATQDLQDVRLFKEEYVSWAVFYFKREADLTAFLLKWA